MSLAYFDSSAFVKLLVEEEGSELAAILWDSCDAALSSRLAYPEVRAALAAARRARRLTADQEEQTATAWEGYWAATRAVELTQDVSAHAGDLAGRHALRGADAVHLASVLALETPDVVLAVWDARLREAATAEGVMIAPGPSATPDGPASPLGSLAEDP